MFPEGDVTRCVRDGAPGFLFFCQFFGEEVEEGFFRGGVFAFRFGDGFVGVHEFFGVGAGVYELADTADDAVLDVGGGGERFFFRGFRLCRAGGRAVFALFLFPGDGNGLFRERGYGGRCRPFRGIAGNGGRRCVRQGCFVRRNFVRRVSCVGGGVRRCRGVRGFGGCRSRNVVRQGLGLFLLPFEEGGCADPGEAGALGCIAVGFGGEQPEYFVFSFL